MTLRYSLQLMDVTNGTLTSLLSYESGQLLDNLPLPPGVNRVEFESVASITRNPIYDKWIALRLSGRIPDQIDPDSGDKVSTAVNILYNYETGQVISLDQLFSEVIFTNPFVWRSDGRRLIVTTFDNMVHVVAFHISGTDWSAEVVDSAPTTDFVNDWIGAGDLLLMSSLDAGSGDSQFYIGEIVNGALYNTQFMLLSGNVFSSVLEGHWYLTASEAEKRELSCLFDQTLPTQLQIGSRARVAFTDGTSSRLRSEPGIEGAEVTLMPEGTEFDIIDGATCIDGYRWWQLELDNAVIGWAAEADTTEYFLEPAGSSQPISLTITVPPTDGTTLATQDDTRFQAVAYDPAVGTNDGDGIQRVEFEVYNPSGALIHSSSETQAAFCAFGGNVPCNIAPSGLLGLPGTYTLKARAQATDDAWTDWVSRTFVVSAGTGTGLLGEYFGTRTLTVPVLNRVDATVDFDWGTGSPDPAVPADKFSVRWNGQVKPLFSETYTFYTRSNDGVRLWVNDQLLVDNWTDHSVTENSGTISLTAGQLYNIRMEYYEKTSDAVAQLSWLSASQPKEIIPQSQLFPGTPIHWTDTTQVVFQSDRDGNNEIYRIDTDGTDPVNLTNNSGSDANAAWYTNSRVVFQTTRDGNSEIYAMNPDGSAVQNLTNHSSYDAYPDVGPDGRVTFASTRDGGNFELYVMNADGSNVVKLTTTSGAERDPAWSPDGQWIVYDVEEGGVKDLWIIPASGGTPTRLTQNAGNNQLPDWSPDGTQIAFQTTRNGFNEIYLMDTGGNAFAFMPGGLNGFSPAWSPDSSAIAFHAWSDSSVPEIYTIEPGGTNRRRLTANSFTDQNPSWGEQ
ncbi:MAG: PD40 domain-containing protein [Anaerolineaceae bacterium]|nr:PD40 domain-containing protein [Anaerolineaceae bacterium]